MTTERLSSDDLGLDGSPALPSLTTDITGVYCEERRPCLLEDEPFQSFFMARALSGDPSRRGGGQDLDKLVVKALQNTKGGLDAAQKWLDLAFNYTVTPAEQKENEQQLYTVKHGQSLEFFVKTYWTLYQFKDHDRDRDRAALLALNKERKLRGYWFPLPADKKFIKLEPKTSEKKEKKKQRKTGRETPSQVKKTKIFEGTAKVEEAGMVLDIAIPDINPEQDIEVSSAYQCSVFDEFSEDDKGDLELSPKLEDMPLSEEVQQRNELSASGVLLESVKAPGVLSKKRRASASEPCSPLTSPSTDVVIPEQDIFPMEVPSSPLTELSDSSPIRTVASKVWMNPRTRADSLPSIQLKAPPKTKGIPISIPSRTARLVSTNTVPGLVSESSSRPYTGRIKKVPRITATPIGIEVTSASAGSSTLRQNPSRRVEPIQASANHFKFNTPDNGSDSVSSRDAKLETMHTTIDSANRNTRSTSARPAPHNNLRQQRNLPKHAVGRIANSSRRLKSPPALVGRPYKRRKSDLNEDVHITADDVGSSMEESTQKKPIKNQPNHLSNVSVGSSERGYLVLSNIGTRPEVHQHAQLSGSRAVTTVLGKRKEKSFAMPHRTAVETAITESELGGQPYRHSVSLPRRNNPQTSQHSGQPRPNIMDAALVAGLSRIDNTLKDSAANALLFMRNEAKELANWTLEPKAGEATEVDDSVYDSLSTENSYNESPLNMVTVHDHETDPRPRLPHHPPIWAQSRQEVCESFDWFRSYQGGVYFSNDTVKGYLLGGFASNRDVFEHDGRLIISHGGGKAEGVHVKDGKQSSYVAEDQMAEDRSVRALLNNYIDGRPLVLLADDRYKLFPWNLSAGGYTYVVLGFFYITHAWAEHHAKSDGRSVVRYKFAFQWCESQGLPWWTKEALATRLNTTMLSETPCAESSQTQHEPAPLPSQRSRPVKIATVHTQSSSTSSPKCKFITCIACKLPTPLVYHQAWMCLKPECERFWKTRDGSPLQQNLEYDSDFLELMSPRTLPASLPPLAPRRPPTQASDDITTTHAFTRGWHCTLCGRLSCKYRWELWECAHCENKVRTRGRLRKPNEFWSQIAHASNHRIGEDSGIIKPFSQIHEFNGVRCEHIMYILPHGRGKIHLIRGNPRANSSADIIFQDYQEDVANERIHFRRYPLRTHKCRGTLLTNYFSQNSGEPYQYIGGTGNTVPFSEASQAVLKALTLIQTRASSVMKKVTDFNEILSAAYMEKQKMAFHSDSERGLGEVVASLSLGSAALMHFRLHGRLRSDIEGKANTLTLTLRHGDVLIMDGAGVQECYEHTVVPYNFRIAATARWIGGT